MGIRAKLIGIFVLIKIVPLVVLAWVAWQQVRDLGREVGMRTDAMADAMRATVDQVGRRAVADSIRALDLRSREAIERLTTDTARAVADFLYDRDRDARMASDLEPTPEAYALFLARSSRAVLRHGPWRLKDDASGWEPAEPQPRDGRTVASSLPDNERDFHYRPGDLRGHRLDKPLYHEMTFVDLDGRERVKVVASPLMDPALKDITKREHTFVKAEDYWSALRRLQPGDVWVSDVVGAYVGSKVIGTYTPAAAAKAGIPFAPDESAYAGKENPVGRRFQGIVRWATPVTRDGQVIGWVTLALDHDHIREFTDHLMPTDERYSDIADAGAGNYAFMWDYQGRSIVHPRDYFIYGFDPDTGTAVPPYFDQGMYERWQKSGLDIDAFLSLTPEYHEQSLTKKPSPDLVKAGRVPLVCRYLNHAPQCRGWEELTRHGGSGSFVIYWSGLWKLTTAAAIPYYTGKYGESRRGFGFVTIGANVDEFHEPAARTQQEIEALVVMRDAQMRKRQAELDDDVLKALARTAASLSVSTLVMVGVVILIAVWMASVLTRRITGIIGGMQRFEKGELDARLPAHSGDEMGELARSFNLMADRLERMIRDSQAHYKLLAENAEDVIWVVSPERRFVYVSPSVAHLRGMTAAEVMAAPLADAFCPGSLPQIAEAVDHWLAGERSAAERLELEQPCKDGSTVWTECVLTLLHEEDGALVGVLGVSRDITERRRAQEELLRSQKMASLGALVAGVAHEINTPVGVALTAASTLHERTTDVAGQFALGTLKASGLRGYMEVAGETSRLILTNLMRSAELIQSFKAVAVDQTSEARRTFDLSDYLEEVVSSLQPQLKRTPHRVEVHCPRSIAVDGHPGALAQVVTNLVINALTHAFTRDAPGRVLITGRLDGGDVEITFADDGRGIPPEHLGKVFDPFFTTRRGQGGSGLGLHLVHNVVSQALNGSIDVASAPGQGTVFTVRFPRTPEAAEREAVG